MPTSNFDELPVSGGVVSAEKMPFHLAQAILLCLDDGCDRTEILSLKEDGATAALDDYDRKIKWKADWVQQVADFVDENAGPLGWDYDGDEQSVLTQLLNATKKRRRRVVPAAGGGNVASPKSPRSIAGSLKMPRRAAPPGFFSVGAGSHLNYAVPPGAGNHLHFFGAPARSADELQAGHFPVGPDHGFYGFGGPGGPGAGNGDQAGVHGVYGVPGVPGMPGMPGVPGMPGSHASMAPPPPAGQPPALDAGAPQTGAPSSRADGSPAAAGSSTGMPPMPPYGSSTGMPPMPPYGVPGVPGMYVGGFPAVYGGLPGMSPFAGYGATDKAQKAKAKKLKAREARKSLEFQVAELSSRAHETGAGGIPTIDALYGTLGAQLQREAAIEDKTASCMLDILKDVELAKRDAKRDLDASLGCLSSVSAAEGVKAQWRQMAELSLCSQLHMIFRKAQWVRKIDFQDATSRAVAAAVDPLVKSIINEQAKLISKQVAGGGGPGGGGPGGWPPPPPPPGGGQFGARQQPFGGPQQPQQQQQGGQFQGWRQRGGGRRACFRCGSTDHVIAQCRNPPRHPNWSVGFQAPAGQQPPPPAEPGPPGVPAAGQH